MAALSSSIIFSRLLNRYFLPNIWMTEQNLHSNGQPRDVAMGRMTFRAPALDQREVRRGVRVKVRD